MSEHSNPQESMLRRLYLWGSKIDGRWLLKNFDARRRKKGKMQRVKPPWRDPDPSHNQPTVSPEDE